MSLSSGMRRKAAPSRRARKEATTQLTSVAALRRGRREEGGGRIFFTKCITSSRSRLLPFCFALLRCIGGTGIFEPEPEEEGARSYHQ